MMDEVFVLLRDALKAKGVPFDVIYGPTQVAPAVGATRIQFMRDYDSGDTVLPGRGRFANPRMFAVRAMGGMVRIHAQSTIKSAQRYDHEKLADAIVDQLQVELYKIARNAKTEWRVVRAGFVVDTTLPEGWQGVVYELRFQIDRGVNDVSWVGAKAPEGSYAHASTTSAPDGPGASKQLPDATTRIEQ